jgi:uncharacterized protein (TIGR02231 family)
MKMYLILSLSLFTNFTILAATVNSEIKQVIVYRQGAKITGTAQATLNPGSNEVVIGNLTSTIDPNSIQVNIQNKAVLLSVAARTNFMGQQALPNKIKKLEDSLDLVSDRIEWLKNEQSIYQGEEKLIIDNQKIVNEKEKITIIELSQLADFYRIRLTVIRKKAYENNIALRELNKKKLSIENQLNELKYNKEKETGELLLNIAAEQTLKINISFSYYTPDAGWTPLYDIRSTGANKALELVCKANVNQHTGYDWNAIDLIISTGNPIANNERPLLNPWYIDFYQPIIIRGISSVQKSTRTEAAPEMNMLAIANEEELAEAAPPVPYQVVESTSQMATEYDIKIKQDIPSDGKEHVVPINEYELPASYMYHSVPKLDPHVFLLARIGGYGKYNLLPGRTNLFFEGMYVGQSYLNPEVTIDSLIISLGRDDRISINRNVLKDLTSKQIIAANKKELKGYEIAVRNNKNLPVTIEIIDQIPVSMNKDIVVEIEEQDGAAYNADYGKLTWKVDIAPGETKKLQFIYSVKYPKDKQLSGI